MRSLIWIVCICFHINCSLAAARREVSETQTSPHKPRVEDVLKEKSLKKVENDFDIVTNAEWLDNDDFHFVNGALIRAPIRISRKLMLDFSIYPKMSDAIKKFEYDPKKDIIEVIGEAGGLRMHSWVKVDQSYWDQLNFTIIKGDMLGFKIKTYLWDKSGKTLVVADGNWPKGRKAFSGVIATLFKPLSEVVIGVATKNFRGYIEEEYKKKLRH